MPLPPHINDHIQRAVGALVYRLRKRRLVAVVWASVRLVQELENDAYAVLAERRLDVAVGELLDQAGRIVGERRDGLPDSVYRRFIKAKIRANASQGEIPRIIDVVAVLVDADTVRYTPSYPAGYRLAYIVAFPVDDRHVARLKQRVLDMTNSGVDVASIIEARRGYFGFADDPDASGFNVGTFARVI